MSSEHPIVNLPTNGDGRGSDGEEEVEAKKKVECEFAADGKCLLEELIQRQEDLEHSHQILCKLIKKMYKKLEELDQKFDRFLAGDLLLAE